MRGFQDTLPGAGRGGMASNRGQKKKKISRHDGVFLGDATTLVKFRRGANQTSSTVSRQCEQLREGYARGVSVYVRLMNEG
jgi:hypothetical protein